MNDSIIAWLKPNQTAIFMNKLCDVHEDGRHVIGGSLSAVHRWQKERSQDIINAKLNVLIKAMS